MGNLVNEPRSSRPKIPVHHVAPVCNDRLSCVLRFPTCLEDDMPLILHDQWGKGFIAYCSTSCCHRLEALLVLSLGALSNCTSQYLVNKELVGAVVPVGVIILLWFLAQLKDLT